MNNFNIAQLPRKNFSDIAMSSDGKYITVVSYLDADVCAENFIYDFGISDYNSFNFYSYSVSGSKGRKDQIVQKANEFKDYILSGNYFSDGSVFSSWDYGNTWTLNRELKPKNWVSVDMSADGKTQVVVGRGLYKNIYEHDVIENTMTHVYISTDYGQTWAPKGSSRIWNGVAISPDSSVLLASDSYPQRDTDILMSPPILKHNILISTNSGNGWGIAYRQSPINYYKNKDFVYYASLSDEDGVKSVYDSEFSYFGRKQCKISNSGEYHLISSPVHGILLNNDFGSETGVTLNPNRIDSRVIEVNYLSGYRTLDITNPPEPVYSTAGRLSRTFLPLCCDMSENGKFQIIAGQGFKNETGIDEIAIKSASGLKDGSLWLSNISGDDFVNKDAYLSFDFGQTWSGISTLPKGLMCFSASISDDAQHIAILGRPNSRLFRSPDGTGRYGSDKVYGPWANYKSGNSPGDNLIYYYSNNSGASWEIGERRNVDFGLHAKQTYYLSQKAIGNLAKSSRSDFLYYFNFPENQYLSQEYDIDNWNSRVLISKSGERVAILDQGQILLKNFPAQSFSPPAKNELQLNPGTKNWLELKTGNRFVNDVAISNNGNCLSYIVNSGNLYEMMSAGDENFPNTLKYVLYSGNYKGYLQDIAQYNVDISNAFKNGVIYTSRDAGATWTSYVTPSFPGQFNHVLGSFNSIDSYEEGFYPANLNRIVMSSDGKYQTAFSNMFFASGNFDLIAQPDADLNLYKRRLYTPIYRSSDSGISWSISYLETGPNGLFPDSVSCSENGQTQYFIGANYGDAVFKNLQTEQKFLRLDYAFLKKYSILPYGRNTSKNTINYTLPGVSLYGNAVYKSTDYGSTWNKVLSITSGLSISGTNYLSNIVNDNYSLAVSQAVPSDIYASCEGVTGANFSTARLSSLDCSQNGSSVVVTAENVLGTEKLPAEYNSAFYSSLDLQGPFAQVGLDFDFSEDQSILVVGMRGYDFSVGKVEIYNKSDENWALKFSITGSNALFSTPGPAGELLGRSVSINKEGLNFAIGAPRFSVSSPTEKYAVGRVKVYERKGPSWSQLGDDIIGENAQDYFGQIVKLSADGTRLFIYSPTGGSLGAFSPKIYIYRFDYNNTNAWFLENSIELETDLYQVSEQDTLDIDDKGEMLAVCRPRFKKSGAKGRIELFKLNKRENKWETFPSFISLNNNSNVFFSYYASIKFNSDASIISVFENNNIKVYYLAENSNWVQLGSAITSFSGVTSGWINNEGNLIAFNSTTESSLGKIYIYKYINNSWVKLEYLNINGDLFRSLANVILRLTKNDDTLYLGLPSLNSIAGRIETYSIYQKDFISRYSIECPYSHGRFVSSNFGLQWGYSPNPLVDYYGFTPNGSNFLNRKKSLRLKDIKIAPSNTGVQISIGEPRYCNSKDGKLIGGLYKYYKNKALSNIFITNDNWASYKVASSPSVYSEINISENGEHMSYLDQFDIYDYDDLHMISEGGSRYGTPYISHNYGSSFNPVLKWDRDIETRKACHIGNEWTADEWHYSINNASGFLQTPLIDRSYLINGAYCDLKYGFTFLDYFNTTGKISVPLSEYNNNINVITELVADGDLKVAYMSKSTLDHTNTALHQLSFSRNGKFGVCVANGQITGTSNILGDSQEQAVFIYGKDGSSFLNNKIYINDKYGDFETSSPAYLQSGSMLPVFLPYSGKNISAQNITFNNPVKAEGVIYNGNIEKRFFYSCDSGQPTEFSRPVNGQVLFLLTGKPAFVNGEDALFSSAKDLTSFLPVGTNIFAIQGEPISSVDVIPGSQLPQGINFNLQNLRFEGIPSQTGFFTYGIRPKYCDGAITGPETYFNLLCGTGFVAGQPETKAIFISYPNSGSSLITARIKNTNFTYEYNDSLSSYSLSGVSGYGETSLSPAPGTILEGSITGNYSGYFNLISYQTGQLANVIYGNLGSASWRDVSVVGSGIPGEVYYDFITGYSNASNDIYINFDTIEPGEAIILNESIYFTYNNDPASLARQPLVFFDSIDKLNTNIQLKAGSLVSSEIISSNRIKLYSILSGEAGNNFKLERIISSPNSISFGSRFFTGGRDFRENAPLWSGEFSNLFPIVTKENSGFYAKKFINDKSFGEISGIVWDNSYGKNYVVSTGIYSSAIPGSPSGIQLQYSAQNNKYEGVGIIPSGQSNAFTGLKFVINRSKSSLSENDKSIYLVSGDDFVYSGVINL
jgi:hypothetical protein